MALKEDNVFIPPRTNEVDIKPKDGEGPSDMVKRLQEEVTTTGLYRQLATERKLTDDIMHPPGPPESPVKISGDINLGSFNLQESQKEAREAEAAARKEAQGRLDKVSEELEATREKLHSAELTAVRQSLETQIKILAEAVNRQGAQPDILAQITGIEAVAQKLGFIKGNGSGAGDFDIQLAIKKLDADMKREDRRFQLEMKKDERQWQLEIKKLEQNNAIEQVKANAEKEKMEMLARVPEQIGTAIAKGLIARSENPLATVTEKPHRVITANVGDWGEIECDQCHSLVGVGPTAPQTACATCGTIFDVQRTSESVVEPNDNLGGPKIY